MNTSVLRHCREAARHSAATPPPVIRGGAAPVIRRAAAPFIRAAGALVLAALALGALAPRAGAAPAAFSYQGVLQDDSGNSYAQQNRNPTVEFRLYASATGGSPVWGRACAVTLDDAGLFNTELSDSVGTVIQGVPSPPLAQVLAANAENTLFIGVTVPGTSGEIEPRQKLLPVPYAVVASDVSSASGDFTVAGAATMASAQVAGPVEAQTLVTSGDATVGGNLTVAGSIAGYGAPPVGCIILWSGDESAIPDGWALCNGQTSFGRKTPDLRNRFVVGAGGEYRVHDTGGAKEVTLTVEQMPSHNHSYSFKGADLTGGYDNDNYFYNQHEKYPDNNNTKYTNNTGGGKAHENRPPFYALCYSMRVR